MPAIQRRKNCSRLDQIRHESSTVPLHLSTTDCRINTTPDSSLDLRPSVVALQSLRADPAMASTPHVSHTISSPDLPGNLRVDQLTTNCRIILSETKCFRASHGHPLDAGWTKDSLAWPDVERNAKARRLRHDVKDICRDTSRSTSGWEI